MAGLTAVDCLGAAAGTLTTLAFLPQVVRTWRRRSAADLSLAWVAVFSAGVLLWLVYGILLRSRPIIVANAVTLALTSFLLWCKLRFRP